LPSYHCNVAIKLVIGNDTPVAAPSLNAIASATGLDSRHNTRLNIENTWLTPAPNHAKLALTM